MKIFLGKNLKVTKSLTSEATSLKLSQLTVGVFGLLVMTQCKITENQRSTGSKKKIYVFLFKVL